MPSVDPDQGREGVEGAELRAETSPAEELYAEVCHSLEKTNGKPGVHFFAGRPGQVLTVERRTFALPKEERPSRASMLGRIITRNYNPDLDGPNSTQYVVRLVPQATGEDTFIYITGPRRGTPPVASAVAVTRKDGRPSYWYPSPHGQLQKTTDGPPEKVEPRRLSKAAFQAAVAEATDNLRAGQPIRPDVVLSLQQQGECSEVFDREARNVYDHVIASALSGRLDLRSLSRMFGYDVELPVQNPGYSGPYKIQTAWITAYPHGNGGMRLQSTIFFKDTAGLVNVETIFKSTGGYYEFSFGRVWFCMPGNPVFHDGEPVSLSLETRHNLYGAISAQFRYPEH